jgi:hypothetical protein
MYIIQHRLFKSKQSPPRSPTCLQNSQRPNHMPLLKTALLLLALASVVSAAPGPDPSQSGYIKVPPTISRHRHPCRGH